MIDQLFIGTGVLLIIIAVALKFSQKKKVDAFDEYQSMQQTSQLEAQKAQQIKSQESEFGSQTIRIIYGSQTGTAIRLSNVLAQECEDNNLKAQVIDVIDYKEMPLNSNNNISIFLFATHGEGEPTDNAKSFYEFCKEQIKQNKTPYKGMQYCVFGLGKTSYEHYNAMGKYFRKALGEMGGSTVHYHSEGDDMGSLEDDFDEWKQELWANVKAQLKEQNTCPLVFESIQLSQEQPDNQNQKGIGKAKVIYEQGVQQQQFDNEQLEFQSKQLALSHEIQLLDIYEVRQRVSDGSTLHICLKSDYDYHVGMNLGFFIRNSEQTVQQLLKSINMDGDMRITAKQEGEGRTMKLPFPPGTSVSTILREYVDVQGMLRKKQIKDLASFVQDETTKQSILVLQSDKVTFKQQVEDKKLSLLDIITTHNLQLSIKQLIDVSTRISPRLYTISSSPLAHKGQVHLTASIAQCEKKTGLASLYFQHLQQQLQDGQQVCVRVDFRKSNFLLADDINTPIIMIGPGAGIAPFRGFLWENASLIEQGLPYYKSMTLYFGCRHSQSDYLYKDELKQLQQLGALDELHCAFSRDGDEKVYVQDLIKIQKEQVYENIMGNGKIYICGNTQMGKDVSNILVQIFQEKNNCSLEEAQKEVSLLEESKRLIKELWG